MREGDSKARFEGIAFSRVLGVVSLDMVRRVFSQPHSRHFILDLASIQNLCSGSIVAQAAPAASDVDQMVRATSQVDFWSFTSVRTIASSISTGHLSHCRLNHLDPFTL